MKKWLIVLVTLTIAIAATTAVTFAVVGNGSSASEEDSPSGADQPSDTDDVHYLYDVTVRFNTSVTQEDIDEVAALLRTYDDELEEFVIMESWPPIGRALLAANAPDTIEAELEGKSYVDDVSYRPWEASDQGEPGTVVQTSNQTGGSGNGTAAQHEVTVWFNTSATQADIDEVQALLRTYDQDAELLMTFCFPPMGTAVVTTDAPDTVEAELEAKSHVDEVSYRPWEASDQGEPGSPVEAQAPPRCE